MKSKEKMMGLALERYKKLVAVQDAIFSSQTFVVTFFGGHEKLRLQASLSKMCSGLSPAWFWAMLPSEVGLPSIARDEPLNEVQN